MVKAPLFGLLELIQSKEYMPDGSKGHLAAKIQEKLLTFLQVENY